MASKIERRTFTAGNKQAIKLNVPVESVKKGPVVQGSEVFERSRGNLSAKIKKAKLNKMED